MPNRNDQQSNFLQQLIVSLLGGAGKIGGQFLGQGLQGLGAIAPALGAAAPFLGTVLGAAAPYLPGGVADQEYQARVARVKRANQLADLLEQGLGRSLGANRGGESFSWNPGNVLGDIGSFTYPSGSLADLYQKGQLSDADLWRRGVQAFPGSGLDPNKPGVTDQIRYQGGRYENMTGQPVDPSVVFGLQDLYNAIRNIRNPFYRDAGGIDSLFDYQAYSRQPMELMGRTMTAQGGPSDFGGATGIPNVFEMLWRNQKFGTPPQASLTPWAVARPNDARIVPG